MSGPKQTSSMQTEVSGRMDRPICPASVYGFGSGKPDLLRAYDSLVILRQV